MELEQHQILRVLVVDKDPSFLREARRVLSGADYQVATSPNDDEMLGHFEGQDQPGCLVLGLYEQNVRGTLELQRHFVERRVSVPIVLVADNVSLDSITRVLRGGALDVLRKPVQAVDLLAALERVAPLAWRFLAERASREHAQQSFSKLTPRERQVCVQLSKGQLNKQIASELGISEKTVKYHRGQIMRKLGVGSIAELVRLVDRLPLPASS